MPDFPTLNRDSERESRVYHAATFGDIYPVELAVRVRGADPMTFANTVRDISVAVDPNLQVRDIATAEVVLKREQGFVRLMGTTVITVMLSVLGLAAAGMLCVDVIHGGAAPAGDRHSRRPRCRS